MIERKVPTLQSRLAARSRRERYRLLMLDVDTFLTTLYGMVDDLCQSRPQGRKPGPQASLCPGEVVVLAVFARWSRFAGERGFYRHAETNLRGAFPAMPDRSRFNRLPGLRTGLIGAFAAHLAALVQTRKRPYEALGSSAMPVRDAKRPGAGWLAARADIGWSDSVGWYEGFGLLTAVGPSGVVTGFCFGSASTSDQRRRRPSSP